MYRKALKTIIVALILSICTFSFVACSQQTYTVSIYDGDTVVKTYENLPTNNDLENIAKPGYIFEGAYYDKELTDEFNAETFGKLNADLTLYLKYEKQSFIVQVNSNGGTAVSPVMVYYDTAYEIPAPTKQGYTFAGYTLDGEDFPQVGTYTKTNGIKLFANWVINSYEVKFLNANDNNAQIGDTLTKEYDTKITSLPTVANGYEIENGKVYSDAECTQEVNLSTYKVTENTNLYVKVAPCKYTVTINSNGGTQIDQQQVSYNTQYTLPIPQKVGFDFAGYTFNGAPFATSGTFNVTSNVTLFATWEVSKFDVKFLNALNDNAQLGSTLNVVYNSTLSLPQVEEGYEIENGKVYSDSACTQEIDLTTYKVTENANLYVKVVAKQFTIKINKNGGDDIQNVTVLYKGTYNLVANPTRTGYTFTGYTLNGQAFAISGTYNYTSDVTIDANWEAIEGFYDRKIIFKDGNAELTAYERDVKVGDAIKLNTLPTLTKTGYEFNGWYLDEALTTAFVDTVISNDLTLYAKFTNNKYLITVNSNGGSAIEPLEVEYDKTYTLATPTKTGYEFTGYTFNGTAFDITLAYTKTYDVTLVATWKICSYEVKFLNSENDGQLGNSIFVDYNNKIIANQLPTASEGYELKNGTVYFDKACTQAVNLETYTVTGSVSLYVEFVAKTFTIEIVTNNGTQVGPVTVTYGTVPTLPSLTKNGYKFVKFVEFGTSTTFDATANYNRATNVTIEAVWEELIVEVGENSNEDQYNLVKTENYFKEKSHYNEEGEYTYVFIKGIPYSFSGMTISTTSNLVNIQNNGFTATNTGTFKLTIAKTVDDTPVTYVRNAKVVENVASFNVNETRNPANFNSNTLVEAMSVGTANGYKPDITIKNVNDAEIGFGDGNVIITATNVKNNGVIYLDSADYNAATGFNLSDLTVGETYEFSFIPKYYVGGNTATIKVTINDGVNVYTNAELRSAFANLKVHKINVLRDIKAELTSDQYDNGNVHNPYHVLYNTNTNKYQWTDGFSVAYNQDGTINTNVMKNGWVYSRSTVGTNDSITINGNSFKLDASTLPRVNGGIANAWVTFANMAPGTERVVNQHAFIFSYMSHKPNDVNTAVNNGNTFNVNDLAIYGNNTLASDITTKYGKDGESYYEMSASYNSLRIMGGNLNATNVSIRNSLISFFISGDSDTVTEGTNGYATVSVLDNCYVENSWANSICTFYLNHLTVKNSTIKNSGGAAIHFDCAPYPGVSTQNSTLVLENTQISNWVLGTESWLTAYQMSPTALAIKAQLEQGLNENGLSCIKNIEGKGEAFNFAIFYQKVDADNTAGWDKMNVGTDYQGKPYVEITNTSKSWATELNDEQIQGALGMPPSYIPHWYTHTADIGVSVGLMLTVKPFNEYFTWAV